MQQDDYSAEQEAHHFIATHNVMTLATTGTDGVWAAAVFYASFDFDLIFLSAGTTRHAQHVAHQPRIAATIQGQHQSWESIRGIQLEGIVRQLHAEEREQAMAHYSTKFPFLSNAPDPIRRALPRVNWYRLTPDLLYFVDNSQGFGHRATVIDRRAASQF